MTLYRYSDTNTYTDNLTLEQAQEFQRLQGGGTITPIRIAADTSNPEWRAAAAENAKLRTAIGHLGNALRSIDFAKQRLNEAQFRSSIADLTHASRTIEEELNHIRQRRNKLLETYQLEY